MEIIRSINDLNKAISSVKDLGFVPTMGGLHDGHKSLINASKYKSKKTIVSIFVNPKQFNKKKDFKSYPRNIKKDLKILKKLKVNYLFIPSIKEIYNNSKKKNFKLNKNDIILCAKYRKGHFEGVLDVMDRLLGIIKPKYLFMGEKDFQQLFLIKKFFKNKYNAKIISCPIIRDKGKVALSSRNTLLKKIDLVKAGFIAKYLINIKKFISKKNILLVDKKKLLEKQYSIKIEYLEARNIYDLKTSNFTKKYKLFIAYYINGIRLIDNF